MASFTKQISYFVQGQLIFEQFIWNIPLILLCGLGVINEMQTITYITIQNKEQIFSGQSEMNILTSISRPNIYLATTVSQSYLIFCSLCILIISCIVFSNIVKNRSTDIVIKLQLTISKSQSMKILMQFINISINLIKYGFGYMAIEICLKNLKANLDDIFQILINLINILVILITLLFFTNMFTYNWALDFKREHLLINDSYLTYYRIFIRCFQIVILIQDQSNLFFQYVQIFLPIISSFLLIYQIQIQKQLIYGPYYQVILIIAVITLIISFQFLFHQFYPQQKIRSLWILLSILPYQIFQYYARRDLIQNFINFLECNIQNSNYVMFQIIYNVSLNKRIFQSDMVYLLFLQKHSTICQDSKCRCKYRLQEVEFQTLSHEIFFKELLQKHQRQLLQITKRNISEPLIFSYLQLLFFHKKYLLNYKLFKIIFNKNKKYKQYSALDSSINRSTIQINSFHKLLVLKVAQDLQRLDIQKQLQNQRSSLKIESQQIHLSIFEYLKITKQNAFIQEKLSKIIETKIKYFESLYQQNNQENLEQLALNSISVQIEGLKIIKASFQQIQTQRYSNILRFYNMEVLNDLISAQSIIQPQIIKEEYKIKSILSNLKNQFSNMSVLIQDLDNIQITKHKYHQSIYPNKLIQLSFDQMIPHYIKQIHKKLIENFISGNQNKYYQQINQAYIEHQSCLCIKIDLIMDISLLNLESIEIIIFFQKKHEEAYSLFLDENHKIINIEEELFCQILNIDKIFANQLYGLNINLFLDNFSSLKQNEKHFSFFFRFFDQRKLNLLTQRKFDYSIFTQKDMILYQCDLEVISRQITDEQIFYQIILSNIKQINGEATIQNLQKQNNHPLINESIIIDKPEDFNEKFNINVINAQNNNEYQILQDEQVICNYQQDEILFTPKIGDENQILSQGIEDKTVKQSSDIEQHTESVSLQSSLSAIEKSKFYKQFLLVQSLTTCRKLPNVFLRKSLLILLFLIISIIGLFLYFLTISNFDLLFNDFKLLSFKNNVFQPISSFTLIRFSIINYNIELYYNLISEQQFQELLDYPNSKIIESYEKLKSEITKFLEQKLFFSHYSQQSFQLQFLEHESQGSAQEFNLRNSLIILLNYQYDSQIVYSNGQTADQKSPYFYYSYKNFNTLLNAFQYVDNQALYQVIKTSLYYETQLQDIKIYSILIMSIIQLLISMMHYLQCLQREKLRQLLFNQENTHIASEIQRLQNLKDLVIKNYTQILNYKFNFQEKDNHFTNIKLLISHFNQNKNRKKLIITIEFLNLKTFLLIISHFLILIAIYLGLEIEMSNKYVQIRNAAQFYEQLTRLNVNILVMYASREVLYFRQSFTFLNQNDIDKYYQNCKQGIIQLEDQITHQQIFQYNSHYIDDSFNQLINKFSQQNLCDQLEAIDKTLTVCNKALSGSLEKGLISTIVDIKNSFKQEFEQSNFTNRNTFPIYELEGITIVSYALQYLIENFYSILYEKCLELQFQYSVKFIKITNRLQQYYAWYLVLSMDQYYQILHKKSITKNMSQ
ncbi:unnamed protein product [Paramecium sonneborni]|uniref:Transmembrane protein n=1 Tax=Paramecium sonneborni TaxID=65129 RepID=A0A8S1MMH9_9CILI|nr:unnamed protein product [Paramecium sonneborni]